MKKLVAVLLLCLASAAYGEIYTWKDARGTVFYTNSLHEIPARYMKKAKVLDVATGKKSPITPTQPVGQTGVASAPAPQHSAQSGALQPPPAQQPVQPAPAQQAAPAPPAPASAAVATPPAAVLAAPPAASSSDQQRISRAQRRAQARQNRVHTGEE